MRIKQGLVFISIICCALSLAACRDAQVQASAATEPANATLAFGSCLRQWQQQPVWKAVQAMAPSAFVFLGDNVYTDVGDYRALPEPERIGQAYADLARNEEFSAFRRHLLDRGIPLLGTWDDHDYGVNDGGSLYRHKLASKQYFLDFFGLESTVSGDATRAGIYQSHRLRLADLDVQLLLLDTRSFRSPLNKSETSPCSNTKNIPNTDPNATVLGAEQWHWLEQQLKAAADLRVIASSIQVLPEQHCYEKWANFPLERQRLFDLIRSTAADAVILISGDRHMAEISRADVLGENYPLYEVTSSGLNSAMGLGGRLVLNNDNALRSGDAYYQDNFAAISVVQGAATPQLALQILSRDGVVVEQQILELDSLHFTQ